MRQPARFRAVLAVRRLPALPARPGPADHGTGCAGRGCRTAGLQRLAGRGPQPACHCTVNCAASAACGIGLPLALACFWLFPRLSTPLWGVPERAVGTPGLADSMAPDQWLDLMADDTPALRVQFFGAVPEPAALARC